MGGPVSDGAVRALRDEIATNDRAIVAAVNRRLELVARLKEVKTEHGLDFLDPGREEWLVDHLAETNGGPLSEAGVRAFAAELLALTKRELADG
jgi:chorismate mutase